MAVIADVAGTGIATRLLIPHRAEDIISRQRSIDLLHDNIGLRAQIISAPGRLR